jgi:hypothetical protein
MINFIGGAAGLILDSLDIRASGGLVEQDEGGRVMMMSSNALHALTEMTSIPSSFHTTLATVV